MLSGHVVGASWSIDSWWLHGPGNRIVPIFLAVGRATHMRSLRMQSQGCGA